MLKVLPVPKNLLEASGIKATVAEGLSNHGKSSTRALAQQLLGRWEPKPAHAAPAAQPKADPTAEGAPRASLLTHAYEQLVLNPCNHSTGTRWSQPAFDHLCYCCGC